MVKTLDKDPSKDYESAYIAIYEKIRPGSQVTFENAKKYIDYFI